MLLLALSGLASGCYYGHLAVGQTRILLARESIADILDEPDTDPALRSRLVAAQRARDFAVSLGLDVGGQYTSYVAWPQDRIITSMVVCQPGRIEPRPFRFPLIGSVPYKGYFDQARAEREAASLREEGLDVCLIAVSAYSTLGFFDDPLTDPMLRGGEGRVVETVIHELVHATVFLESQPDFNEGVANFIGEEASVLFYADQPAEAQQRRLEIDDDRRLSAALMEIRSAVGALYAEGLVPQERVTRRSLLEREARVAIAALPLTTRDAPALAEQIRLNDACLALRSTYEADVPRYAATLQALGGSLPGFIERLARVEDADDPRAAFFADARPEAAPDQVP